MGQIYRGRRGGPRGVSLKEGVYPRETSLGDAPMGTGVHSIKMGIPAVTVERGMGPPTEGRGESGSSDHAFSIGREGSSGKGEGCLSTVVNRERSETERVPVVRQHGLVAVFFPPDAEGVSAFGQGKSVGDISTCQERGKWGSFGFGIP